MRVLFTTHAEQTLRRTPKSQLQDLFPIFDSLGKNPDQFPAESISDIFGSPTPAIDVMQVEIGRWRIVYAIDDTLEDPAMWILSFQPRTQIPSFKYKDIFDSVVTEVGSSAAAEFPDIPSRRENSEP